jgi:hypothetical protein
MGGAYGCFIQFNHLTGNFGMISYRDPQVKKTYDAYEALPKVIGELNLSQESMQQLVVGAYGTANPHQGPAVKGATARNNYLAGVTRAFRQQRVEEIVRAGVDDLRGFAPHFARLQEERNRVTVGNSDKIQQDKALFDEVINL